MKDYEINALGRAKGDVMPFLVHPAELAFMETSFRAEYMFFLTCYLEEKHSIESQEEQKLLTVYLDPDFGVESFERKIKQSQENMKQYIRRLDRLVAAVKEANKPYGKLEEVECNHEYNAISDYCIKCSEPIVRGYFE